MKKLIILSAIAGLFFTSCGTTGSPKSEKDSLAYAIGIDLGKYYARVDSTTGLNMNLEMVFAAMRDVKSKHPKMTDEEAMAYVRDFFTMKLPAQKKAESEAFLASVEKDNKNVQRTASGLLYEIIRPGSDARSTNIADQVRVLYRGTLRNGTEFDSSYSRGDTAQFVLNQVIPGWTEGMQLIGPGGKIKLWVPPSLAYGEQGQGPIGPNEALIFEVELIEVIPAEPLR